MFILTEKPSVAKDIASGLGGYTYNKDGYFESGNNVIVPAQGHLLELLVPEDYDKSYAEKWSLEQLPIAPT